MAYKDPSDPRARESRRKHYENNKQRYIDNAARTRQVLDLVCANCHAERTFRRWKEGRD